MKYLNFSNNLLKKYNLLFKNEDFMSTFSNRNQAIHYSAEYNHFLFSFFLKKNFQKIGKNFFYKSNGEKKKQIKLTNNLINSIIRGGKKLSILKQINFFRKNFYSLFLKKNDFFLKKFPTYSIFYNFSLSEKKFFNLDFLFDIAYKTNESVFIAKVIRLNKKTKQKNKTKSKYAVDFQYLSPEKRKLFFLKQIHLYSNNYNFYQYNQRLLTSFFNTFFLEKNSDIYKNKLQTYHSVLKKNSL